MCLALVLQGGRQAVGCWLGGLPEPEAQVGSAVAARGVATRVCQHASTAAERAAHLEAVGPGHLVPEVLLMSGVMYTPCRLACRQLPVCNWYIDPCFSPVPPPGMPPCKLRPKDTLVTQPRRCSPMPHYAAPRWGCQKCSRM